MTYTTLDSYDTTEGVHVLLAYVNDVVPIFTPLILLGAFIIAFLGSYFASISIRGDANLSASFAAAGFFVAIIATFMSFMPGVIGITALVMSYGIAILGFLWLVLDKN